MIYESFNKSYFLGKATKDVCTTKNSISGTTAFKFQFVTVKEIMHFPDRCKVGF